MTQSSWKTYNLGYMAEYDLFYTNIIQIENSKGIILPSKILTAEKTGDLSLGEIKKLRKVFLQMFCE